MSSTIKIYLCALFFNYYFKYQYDYSKSSLTALQHNTMLDIYEQVQKERSTGIICTIGPRSNSVEVLSSLMQKGMDVTQLFVGVYN